MFIGACTRLRKLSLSGAPPPPSPMCQDGWGTGSAALGVRETARPSAAMPLPSQVFRLVVCLLSWVTWNF